MNDFDDLLGGAVGHRADAAPTLRPDFSDVLSGRQQQTRRRTAVATVALLAVGVTGMAAFAVGGTPPAGTADGPVGSDGYAVPTTMLMTPSDQLETIWYCEGQLDGYGPVPIPIATTTAPPNSVAAPVDSMLVEEAPSASATPGSGYFRQCVIVEGGPMDESTVVAPPDGTYATEATTTTRVEEFDNTVPTTVPSPGGYTVQAGDSPISIAEKFGIPVEDLLEINGWTTGSEFPFPGEQIAIPALSNPICTVPGCELGPIHIVQPGDYLIKIAADYCVTVDDILAANGWETVDELGRPGDRVFIPPSFTDPAACPPPTT